MVECCYTLLHVKERVCDVLLSMGTHQGHTVLCAVWWKRMESVGTIAKCLL